MSDNKRYAIFLSMIILIAIINGFVCALILPVQPTSVIITALVDLIINGILIIWFYELGGVKIYRPEQPVKIDYDNSHLIVTLADGRILRKSFTELRGVHFENKVERENYELGPTGIYWPDWDDGIDIDWLIETVDASAPELNVD